MEVREGYKQTDVGVIPEDWGIQSYDELFSFLSTATYSRSQLSRHEEVQYLHYGDIHTKYDHHIDFSKHRLPSISDELVKSYAKLKDGDIVMADASEDYSGICKSIEVVNIEDKQAIAGLHTFLLRDTSESFVNGFRGYISSSSILKQQYDQYATGMKVYGVSKTNLKKILIPIPPKPEQKAIAKALSDVDTLIASIEQLIEKKRLIKQGAMQELLTGKRRLAGFEVKKGYKQTEIGKIPEDWEIKQIGTIVNLLTGFPFSSNLYSSSGVRLLRGFNIKRGNIEWTEDGTKYWSNIDAKLQPYILRNKDIVIAMDGSLVGSSFAILTERDIPSLLVQRIARVRAKSVSQDYLKEWICSDYFTKYCDTVKTVTAIPHISPQDIRNYTILCPSSIEEQEAIATILSDMDTEIETLEVKLHKTREIKEGMMHELLTRRIRLI